MEKNRRYPITGEWDNPLGDCANDLPANPIGAGDALANPIGERDGAKEFDDEFLRDPLGEDELNADEMASEPHQRQADLPLQTEPRKNLAMPI